MSQTMNFSKELSSEEVYNLILAVKDPLDALRRYTEADRDENSEDSYQKILFLKEFFEQYIQMPDADLGLVQAKFNAFVDYLISDDVGFLEKLDELTNPEINPPREDQVEIYFANCLSVTNKLITFAGMDSMKVVMNLLIAIDYSEESKDYLKNVLEDVKPILEATTEPVIFEENDSEDIEEGPLA